MSIHLQRKPVSPISQWAAGAAVLLASMALQAQQAIVPAPQNVIQLSANATLDAPQDLLTLAMSTTREGPDAATVQNQLKVALDAALTESLRVFRSCPLITPKHPCSLLQMLAIARAMAALCA